MIMTVALPIDFRDKQPHFSDLRPHILYTLRVSVYSGNKKSGCRL